MFKRFKNMFRFSSILLGVFLITACHPTHTIMTTLPRQKDSLISGLLRSQPQHFDSLLQNLDEYGSRLDSLERSHQWWIPAAWSIGTTVVCGLLVWGFTKFLGKKKKEDRTQEPKEPSDEESDVEDAGIPVGRKRPVGNQRRGRRPHARAWRVAPDRRQPLVVVGRAGVGGWHDADVLLDVLRLPIDDGVHHLLRCAVAPLQPDSGHGGLEQPGHRCRE